MSHTPAPNKPLLFPHLPTSPPCIDQPSRAHSTTPAPGPPLDHNSSNAVRFREATGSSNGDVSVCRGALVPIETIAAVDLVGWETARERPCADMEVHGRWATGLGREFL